MVGGFENMLKNTTDQVGDMVNKANNQVGGLLNSAKQRTGKWLNSMQNMFGLRNSTATGNSESATTPVPAAAIAPKA